jgi:hypothetical protein
MIKIIIYFGILAAAFVLSLVRIKKVTRALRIISILLGLTLGVEAVALWMNFHYNNNMPAYQVAGPVQLFVIALYYQEALPRFKKYKTAYWLGGLGIIAALLNGRIQQHTDFLNAGFLLFEGLCVVAMALYAFYFLILKDVSIPVFSLPLFWISFVFLFFWCSTFIAWALFNILRISGRGADLKKIYLGLWLINLACYCALAAIFFIKKPASHD